MKEEVKKLLILLLKQIQFKEETSALCITILPDSLDELLSIQKRYQQIKEEVLTQSNIDKDRITAYLKSVPSKYLSDHGEFATYLNAQIREREQEYTAWENNLTSKILAINRESTSIVELKPNSLPISETPTSLTTAQLAEIFIKHTKLDMLRKKLNINLNHDTLDLLHQKHDQYFFIKRDMYSKRIPKKEMSVLLSTVPANLITDQERFKKDLLDKIKRLLDELSKWEQAFNARLSVLDNSWSTKLWNYGRSTLNFLYRTTLVSMGADLGHWIGNKIAYTEKINIPYLCKIAGGAVSVYFMARGGRYTLIRTLSINLSCMLLNNHLLNGRMNDQLARIDGLHFGMPGIFRTANMLVAGGESLIHRDYRYVSFALGGILGSVGVTSFAKRFLLTVHENLTQEQAFILFFLSMLGYNHGQWLTQKGFNVVEKNNLMKIAIQTIEKLNTESEGPPWISAENANSLWSPRFWFGRSNIASIKWAEPSGKYYTAQCELDMPGKRLLFDCETPRILQHLPLPASLPKEKVPGFVLPGPHPSL